LEVHRSGSRVTGTVVIELQFNTKKISFWTSFMKRTLTSLTISFPDPNFMKRPLTSLTISVPDPKLTISDLDLDPQVENQEFRIRIWILDLDPSVD